MHIILQMIIKDSMVVIHLAKITLLEKSCDYFKNVAIPEKVYEEVLAGKEKGYSEVSIIETLIINKKISMKKVGEETLLKKANEFNIHKGEAEAVALYWQNKADFLAIDDDNVRKKSTILNIRTIGTPSIILKLYKEKIIEKDKTINSLNELKKIVWFSNAIIDKILMEIK